MIFYEIKLLSLPTFRFAFMVEVDDYKTVFHGLRDFLEISVIEAGDVIVRSADGGEEIRRAHSINCICSDTEAVYSALNGEHQRHTTACVCVKYDHRRRSTDEHIDVAELRERIRSNHIVLVPDGEPLGQAYENILSQLKKVVMLKNSPNECDSLRALSAWFSLAEALTSMVLARIEDKNKLCTPATSLYVKRAQDYIHENYREGVTVASVSEAIGISSGYLHTIFKAHVGMGITEYTNIYRVELAKQLILTYDLPLREIAELVGVTDPAYMSRLFRKVSGISYNEFRQNHSAATYEK